MPPGGTPGHASYVLGEIEKIRRYLNSLRQLPHDSPLDVYVIGSRALLTDITRQSPDSLTTRHHLLEVDEVAEMVGIKGQYGSEYSDGIFAYLLAKKRLPNQYAPANQTRHNTMYRARIGLIAASILLVVASLFLSGSNVFEAIVAIGDTATARQRSAFYDERVEIARGRMPKIPGEPQDIKSAVQMAEKLRRYKTTPLAMAVILSQGLADYPRLKLDQIDWRVSTDPDAPVSVSAERANVRRRSSSARSGDSGEKRLYQLADIEGRVAPFDGNFREALDLVNQFVETLVGLPEVEAVEVLERPLDTGSDRVMRGNTQNKAGEARFKLHIVVGDGAVESS